MALDAFIKFEGGQNKILGESLDKSYPSSGGWSSLTSVTFSSKNTANIGTGSAGAGSGKVSFEDFSIVKNVDNGSPQFFMALCAGDHYDTVTIAIRKAGGGGAASDKAFLQYKFALVFVTSISTTVGAEDEAPSETITFAYGATQIQYTPQKPDGSFGTANPTQWSRVKNNNTLTVA